MKLHRLTMFSRACLKGRASTRNHPSNTDMLYTIEGQKRYNEKTISSKKALYITIRYFRKSQFCVEAFHLEMKATRHIQWKTQRFESAYLFIQLFFPYRKLLHFIVDFLIGIHLLLKLVQSGRSLCHTLLLSCFNLLSC